MNPLLLSKLAELRNISLERATSLRERANAKEQLEQRWMSQALEELDVTHEELRVVEEELHTQTEELSAVYGALEQDRSRYRDLFEGAPEPYLVTDTAGVILEANALARRFLNIDSAFVIGKPISLYVWGEDRALMREVLGLLNSTSERSSFEMLLRPRGASLPVDVLAMVHREREHDGSSSSLRWILHERRAAQNRVRDSRPDHAPASEAPSAEQAAAAETYLEQLEADLAREQLRRIEAENALQRRNDHLAFIAHELRNPLSTTVGWLEILNQDATGVASRRHVLGVLTRNVKTLARMVGELVDRTRVVQGLVVLDCEETDFAALLGRVCDDARGMAHSKHLQFTCEIDPSVGVVRCDAYRIQQALINVLGNAVKFTSSDGGKVEFFAAGHGDMVECVVHDTGPGIAAEYLKTIFEPFIRVNPRGGTPGLGLGLNIALTLIELHGGSITAESDGVGHGAKFRIRLPVAGPDK